MSFFLLSNELQVPHSVAALAVSRNLNLTQRDKGATECHPNKTAGGTIALESVRIR